MATGYATGRSVGWALEPTELLPPGMSGIGDFGTMCDTGVMRDGLVPLSIYSFTIFGKKAEVHRMFAEQLVAEYSIRTEGRGRTVDEWKVRPGLTENHFLDCLVGCAVAASEQGVILAGTGGATQKRKPAIRLSKLRKGKRS